MTTDTSIADSVARLRKARDLSQEQLAEAANLSVDTVARIEQGRRKNIRPATMRNLARALDINTTALLGHVPTLTGSHDVAALRQAVFAGDHIPGLTDFAEPCAVVPLGNIVDETHLAWQAYVDGRHEELLSTLPTLILDARRLVRSTADDEKGGAYRVLSTVYRLAAGIAGRLEYHDLAWSAAERALAAARSSDAPETETAVAIRYLTWTLVRQGRLDDAERVALAAAEQVQPKMLDQASTRTAVFGNLLFNAASAALASGRADRATDLLTEAHTAAVRTGENTATEAAIFGPRVAALQRIEHMARADDPERALRIAEKLPSANGSVPAFWEAGHPLALAAAAAKLRMDQRSLSYLAGARGLAPDWSRRQPLGRNTMTALIERATRRRGPEFSELATHYAVVPR